MRILVVYGTHDGQTRKVAEFLADRWRKQSHTVELCEAAHLPKGLDPAAFNEIVVASSMRMGAYRPSVVRFVQHQRAALTSVPSAFVSVSMAAANTRNRQLAQSELQKYLDRFCKKTGWTPAHIHHAAGGLPYTRYDWVTRWVMKRIARSQGYDTDTTCDHEYTDWNALAAFADLLVASPDVAPVAA